jgi:hypothetical protein
MLAIIHFSLLSSCLLSSNPKVKLYKTIILPVVLYECETYLVSHSEGRAQGSEKNIWTKEG